MSKKIKITASSVTQTAQLDDSICAQKIWDALPFKARASAWGGEDVLIEKAL